MVYTFEYLSESPLLSPLHTYPTVYHAFMINTILRIATVYKQPDPRS